MARAMSGTVIGPRPSNWRTTLARASDTASGRCRTGAATGAGSVCARRYCSEKQARPASAKWRQYSDMAVLVPTPSEKASLSFEPRWKAPPKASTRAGLGPGAAGR